MILILLIPGMFVGMLLSENVHLINVWLMVLANFIIYSGGAYLVLAKWVKRRKRRPGVET